MKETPETTNVQNKNQLKHAAIPKNNESKIPPKQVIIKQKSPSILFASGQYVQAIELININLKNKIQIIINLYS